MNTLGLVNKQPRSQASLLNMLLFQLPLKFINFKKDPLEAKQHLPNDTFLHTETHFPPSPFLDAPRSCIPKTGSPINLFESGEECPGLDTGYFFVVLYLNVTFLLQSTHKQ